MVPAIFDTGVHIPLIALRPSVSAGVGYSMQRAVVGQSASFRHSFEQKLPVTPVAAMQSESSAQRIPSAGSGEQSAPNASPAGFASTQVSWKPSPLDSSGPRVQVRRPHRESAPDSG